MHLHTLVLRVGTYLPLFICFSLLAFRFLLFLFLQLLIFSPSRQLVWLFLRCQVNIANVIDNGQRQRLVYYRHSSTRCGLELGLHLVRFSFAASVLDWHDFFAHLGSLSRAKSATLTACVATMPTTRPLTISIPSLASRAELRCQVLTKEKINFSRSMQGHIINKISTRTRMVSVWLRDYSKHVYFFLFFKSISVNCTEVEFLYFITISINLSINALIVFFFFLLNTLRFILVLRELGNVSFK